MHVSVIGESFNGHANWHWGEYAPDIISVNFMGREAIVNPVAEKGQTKIKVWNDDCENTLEITVIIGDRFNLDNTKLPYIYVEKSLYEATKNGSVIGIPYEIVNVVNIVKKNIRYESYSSIISVDHDVDNSVFKVTANETGIARFDIVYGSLRQEVYVLIKDNIAYSGVFLTTSENYVAVSIGELRQVNIALTGYEDIINDNFRWSVNKTGVIGLVGNGLIGQVYGIASGDVVITVKHKNEREEFKAKNELTIHVKVVKDKVKEKVVYLTTQRNVIETVAGANDERIYVQKIGGNIAINHTAWKVSDGSVIDLQSQSYSAAFKALKEGVAKITVENDECTYSLEIIVIVKPALNNGIFISAKDTLLWLSPGEQRKIAVELVNGDPKNYNRFKWSVDIQTPSDVQVKAAKGNVIGIIGSNQECIINAVNEGWAEIRVKNEGKGGAERDLIITVYVSLYKEISFSVGRKELVTGENEFIGINLPTYEYFKDKARVWVESIDGGSSDVCDVFYTNSLVLLNGRKEGTAVVKAVVEGKEGQAQMLVTVVDKINPNLNRIVTGKSIYVLSSRSAPLVLNAIVSGPNMFEQDYEDIRWDFSMDTGKKVVDFIPKVNDATLKKRRPDMPLTKDYQAKGPAIQITPKGGTGTVTITVWHGYVDEPQFKQISIIVADLGNKFSVNKSDVTVNMSRPETITAQITGGTTRDYEEIVWIAKMQQKWDGTMIEVVRIMGSGREITLYPMNDGETEVFAMYNGETISVKVKVVSDYYFSFRTSNEYMFPGEKRDLRFDLKPASSNVNWINATTPGEEPIVVYGEILGSAPGGDGEVNRYLQVEARREGSTIITGMANGKIASVNIIVSYDYFFILENVLAGDPVSGYMPKHNITGNDTVAASSSTGIRYATYTVHPANTYIKAVESTIPDGLEIEIMPPAEGRNSKGQTIGTGKIKFTGLKEMSKTPTFRQYKPQTPGVTAETPVEATSTQPGQRSISVLYCYTNINPTPYFVRGDGKYSNATNPDTIRLKPAVGKSPYRLAKNNQALQGAEYLVGNNLYLSDGEVHYILFDNVYDNAELAIDEITVPNQNDADANLGTVNTVNFKAETVILNIDNAARKAIRLSSDKDYIEYNRVMFDRELFVEVSSFYVADKTPSVQPLYSDLGEKRDVNYNTYVPQYVGSWSRIVPEISDSNINTKKTFYLLDNDILAGYPSSHWDLIFGAFKAKRISLEPYLAAFWDFSDTVGSEQYTYYFTGSEYNRNYNPITAQYANIFNNILNDCRKTDGYKFPRLYEAPFLNMTTNGKSNYQIMVYDHTSELVSNNTVLSANNGQVVSGYILSYYDIDGHEGVRVAGEETATVYRYDIKDIMDITDNDIPVYVNGNQVSFNVTVNFDDVTETIKSVTGWNKGTFTDDYIPHMGDWYNPGEYVYSSINYRVNDYNVNIGDEVVSTYNVFKNVYVWPNGNENIDPPSGVVTINNLTGISYSDYTNDIMSAWHYWDKHCDTYIKFISYDNVKYYPSKGKYSGYEYVPFPVNYSTPNSNGSTKYYGTGGINTVYVSHNPGGYNIFNGDTGNGFGKYYRAHGSHPSKHREAPDGNCAARGRWCYHYDTYLYTAVRQKLSWKDTGKKAIVPYYIFNRFPFRYEEKSTIQQYVKLNHGGGKPMPSISRDYRNNYRAAGNLRIKYKYFDANSRSKDKIEYAYKNIPVYLYVRPCHSQHMGPEFFDPDSYVNIGEFEELEGHIRNFDGLPLNDKTRKFIQ